MTTMKMVSAVLIALAVTPLYSQEGLSSANLAKAEVVVVGTLHQDFKFPWLDGWNERGHIQVERILKGGIGAAQSLPFAWERDFHQVWCITRPDWRGAVGQRGIWLLSRDGSRYRAHQLFFGFLPSKYLGEVLRLLAEPLS